MQTRLCAAACAVLLAGAACGGGPAAPAAGDESGPMQPGGDWPLYRADPSGTGYSTLAQLGTDNVAGLTEAWTYSLRAEAEDESARGPRSQVTPIVVAGVMYLSAADRVVALDPATGAEHWRHTPAEGAPSRRGVAWWPGGDGLPPRILFTTGQHLRAIDAGTGMPVAAFGSAGAVDLGVPYNSVPLVFGDVVVVGANTPPGTIGGIGNARAYDARSGAPRWEFSSVAQPGDIGHDTWAGDSWQDRLGANAWPFYFTADTARNLVYLPLASPIPGAYGGDREGANLYGNSVVAVDAHSGEYRWHFQTIRHDLWDADPPAPPALFDIEQGGRTIPALGVTTKSGYLYILDRETGEPVFGVEERPVPASDVPGEATYPTQPFPVKPPPMGRVSYEPADLVTADDTSAEHAAACAELVESLGEIRSDGPFTPWAYRPEGAAPRTTLNFPGMVGGPNWGGVAYDPQPGYLLVVTQNVGALGWMVDAAPDAPLPYERAAPAAGRLRRCAARRRAAATLPEAALGRADRRGGGHGRHRLARAARQQRRTAGGPPQYRPAGPRSRHHDGRRCGLRRRHRRQPFPGVRDSHRPRTVGDPADRPRQREPAHLPRRRRPPVRRHRRHRHPRGVRAAGVARRAGATRPTRGSAR